MKIKYIITILAVFMSNSAFSKDIKLNTDQLWLINEFKFEAFKNFDFEYSNTLRLDLTNSIVNNSFSEFGACYKLHSFFKVSATLRVKHHIPSEITTEHHFNLHISVPIDDFKIKLRSRYHNKNNSQREKELIRERLSLEYKIKDNLSAEAGAELFYDFSQARNDAARYRGEIKWEFVKGFEFLSGYLYETEFNRNTPATRNVIYLQLNIVVI